MPTYIYGSRDDHIVPWHAAYATTRLLRGPMRFVLGASGHIAGAINPPAKGRRSYWSHQEGDSLPGDPASWPDSARSERRRVGKEGGRKCGCGLSPVYKKKK